MTPRLGINIDHVATLRQARGEPYPSVVDAATTCLNNGADQITIHLREDRRHIQDTDVDAVKLVTKKFGRPLNLEIGASKEIIEIAIATAPDWICLVPENRKERTTEGGLNLKDEETFSHIKSTCERLKREIKGVKISLFLESNEEILKRAACAKIDAVEIHTGEYASSFLNGDNYLQHIDSFKESKKILKNLNLGCHAGHGLTMESVLPLLKENLFTEYNIGHWVVCQAVFSGLGSVVSSLTSEFKKYGDK